MRHPRGLPRERGLRHLDGGGTSEMPFSHVAARRTDGAGKGQGIRGACWLGCGGLSKGVPWSED